MNGLNGLQNNEIRVSVSNEVYARIYSQAKKIAKIPFEKIEDVASRLLLAEAMNKISHIRKAVLISGQLISVAEVDHLAKEMLMQTYLDGESSDAIALLNIYRCGFAATESEKAMIDDAEMHADRVLHPVSAMYALILGNEFIAACKANGKAPSAIAYRDTQNELAATRHEHEAMAKKVRQQAKQKLEAYHHKQIEMHLKAGDLTGWVIETPKYDADIVSFEAYRKAI